MGDRVVQLSGVRPRWRRRERPPFPGMMHPGMCRGLGGSRALAGAGEAGFSAWELQLCLGLRRLTYSWRRELLVSCCK